jgi:hypothetical protein
MVSVAPRSSGERKELLTISDRLRAARSNLYDEYDNCSNICLVADVRSVERLTYLQMRKFLSCSCCWSLSVGSECSDSCSLRQAVCKPIQTVIHLLDLTFYSDVVLLLLLKQYRTKRCFCHVGFLSWRRGADPNQETTFCAVSLSLQRPHPEFLIGNEQSLSFLAEDLSRISIRC